MTSDPRAGPTRGLSDGGGRCAAAGETTSNIAAATRIAVALMSCPPLRKSPSLPFDRLSGQRAALMRSLRSLRTSAVREVDTRGTDPGILFLPLDPCLPVARDRCSGKAVAASRSRSSSSSSARSTAMRAGTTSLRSRRTGKRSAGSPCAPLRADNGVSTAAPIWASGSGQMLPRGASPTIPPGHMGGREAS